jgi:tRNA (mo5U34)-methyltransferase
MGREFLYLIQKRQNMSFTNDNPGQLQEQIDALRWFHQIDFGNGIITPGLASLAQMNAQADIYFSDGVGGLSVLDIGCWDGFNSLEAVRRGATRVLAMDHWVWHYHPFAKRDTVELVREYAAPDLKILDIDLFNIGPNNVGRFDVVLFCGVLYHLRDMLAGLERAASVTDKMLVLETHMDARDIDRPAAIFYPTVECNGDGTNWWGPNRACVEGMISDVGFSQIEFIPHPTVASRGIFKGYK